MRWVVLIAVFGLLFVACEEEDSPAAQPDATSTPDEGPAGVSDGKVVEPAGDPGGWPFKDEPKEPGPDLVTSCEGNCGRTPIDEDPCACDDECGDWDDCCSDYEEYCEDDPDPDPDPDPWKDYKFPDPFDPGKLSTSDCKGMASSDSGMCQTYDCKGMVRKDKSLCSTADCKGMASGDYNQCGSSFCKAVTKGDVSLCSSGDCRAFVRDSASDCTSDQCRAIIHEDRRGDVCPLRCRLRATV